MSKRLRCRLGLHDWRKQYNDGGQMYRHCGRCGKQDDPGSRITKGPLS